MGGATTGILTEPRPAQVRRRWRALARRLDTAPPRRTALLVFLLLAPVYLLTTNWHQAQVNDIVATLYPAHELAYHGSWVMDEVPPGIPWFLEVEGGYVSNRFPGTILHAVPAYRLFGDPDHVTTEPGALTAALLAATAMAVLHLVLRRVTTPTRATVGALIAGLATSTWGISASALWTHTPGQLWIALGLLGLASGAHLRSGLAFAVALVTRPQTAVIAAVAGLTRSVQTRSIRPAWWVGIGSAVGLGAYLAYNAAVVAGAERFDPLAGGYGGGPLRSLLAMPLDDYLLNVANMLVHPFRGVLVMSPFVLVLILSGGRDAWRAAPPWVRAAALAAIAYLLVQARANGFSGGENQLVYRLPLETLTAAAPFLALAYQHGVARRHDDAPWFWASVTLGIAVQVIAAVTWTKPTDGRALFGLAEWERAMSLTPTALSAALLIAVPAAAVIARRLQPPTGDAEHHEAP